jgi:beta-glucosidase
MTNENRNRLREFCAAIVAVALAACLLPCGSAVAAGPADVLLAGTAKTEITPAKPVMLDGYESRKDLSQGIHDPLSARAIAFQRNGQKLVLVSTEVLGFYGGTAASMRKAILEACGLQPSELFLAAIHTHSAPIIALGGEKIHANNLEYTKWLETRLVAAVREALAHPVPVEIAVGTGSSPVGVNRREFVHDAEGKTKVILGRNPAVLTDRDVQVLRVSRTENGDVAAVVFDYATHSTAMGPRNYLVSGDVHGLAAQFLEKYLGGGVIAPEFAGASGDIDPWFRVQPKFHTEKGWVPEAVLLGTMLGEEVAHVLDGIKKPCPSGPIQTVFKTLTLPIKPRAKIKAAAAGESLEFNLTVGRVGDVAVVGIGGEAFNEIGRKIKAASPFPCTLIITHCNGAAGYLPTKDAYPQGGYEVQSSHFAAGAAEQIVAEAVRILHSIASTRADGPAKPAQPGYRDAAQPIERRVDDLLGRMTLEEKVGQINMPCVYEQGLGKTIPEKTEGVQKFAAGTLIEGFGPGGGFFTLSNEILHEGPRQQAEFLNRLQRIAAGTRLGIPLLQSEEGTHGLMCPGGTIFPEGPALGSTWNMELLGRVYATVAREARSIGVHQNFTLVIEPIRDPRLGRNEEAFSEDPLLCARIAETIVRSAQGRDLTAPDKVVTGLCHYPGQSQPVSGLERGAMEISPRGMREVFLVPWQAGIQKCGALGVMATYPAIDGMPTHASKKILTGILREEFGFDGLVLSEGGGIGTLVYEGLAANQKEAGALALAAGVDVGISFESGYMQDLLASVREGKVPIELVDRAVHRVLKQKFRLGLFEKPLVSPEHAVETVHRPAHADLALEAAREAIVLLKNDHGLLPLKKTLRSVAVIGPNADDLHSQLGDYVPHKIPQHIVTVLEGIRQIVPAGTEVTYVKGCEVIGPGADEIEKAKEVAARADAAIVVVGESNQWGGGKPSTNGEGRDSATLELVGRQEELVKAVLATGKPTVVVLINGRPLAVRWIAEHVPAIVEAWLPGERGGQAVAEVLFGDVNPSGKLSVTVPRHVGQLPVYYNMKKSKRYWQQFGWGHAYVDMEPTPLYHFGHGLSYTRFDYSGLQFSAKEIGPAEGVEVQFQVKNAGDRAGKETVQLYVEDLVSGVSTPVKQLRGFAKLDLAPGEARTCSFKLGPDDLAIYDLDLQRVVEPGRFRVMVGSSSEDIRTSGEFQVK